MHMECYGITAGQREEYCFPKSLFSNRISHTTPKFAIIDDLNGSLLRRREADAGPVAALPSILATSKDLLVRRLSPDVELPTKASDDAAGYDLHSAEDCVVNARSRRKISRGLAPKLPPEAYGRIAPRFGLALKNEIGIGGGVIARDYRGEACIIFVNNSNADFEVKKHDGTAQLVTEQIQNPQVIEIETVDPTTRGNNGFGSTGCQHFLKHMPMPPENAKTNRPPIMGNLLALQ